MLEPPAKFETFGINLFGCLVGVAAHDDSNGRFIKRSNAQKKLSRLFLIAGLFSVEVLLEITVAPTVSEYSGCLA